MEEKEKTPKKATTKKKVVEKVVTARQAATMMRVESSLYDWLEKKYPQGTERTAKEWAEVFVSENILDEVPSIFEK